MDFEICESVKKQHNSHTCSGVKSNGNEPLTGYCNNGRSDMVSALILHVALLRRAAFIALD